jgi:parvulin-like peptidyl-prolyl isomerase
MRHPILIAALVAAVLPLAASAAEPPLDAPVVIDGPVKVDVGDIQAAFRRVPENRRIEFRTSYDRVAAMVDNVFLARSLAQKARDAGLDKDPVTQRQIAEAGDAVLAELYLKHIDDTAPKVDLVQRAHEIYLADPAKFTRPEEVHVEHILIGLKGRTREMALERAQQVYQEAKAGKEDFLQLAARWSDDPDKKNNSGDLGWKAPAKFVEPMARWVKEPHAKGEISPPIESDYGFHVVRYVDHKPAELAKFDEVKDKLILMERDTLAKKRREDLAREVRSSSTVVIHKDNVEALVVPAGDLLSSANKAPETPAK